MMNIIGYVMIFGGIVMAAGAGGDCDGKCMEYANTLGETAFYAFMGLTITALGGIIVYNQK